MKRILVLILLLFCLSACAKKTPVVDTETASTATVTTEPTNKETSTTSGTTEPTNNETNTITATTKPTVDETDTTEPSTDETAASEPVVSTRPDETVVTTAPTEVTIPNMTEKEEQYTIAYIGLAGTTHGNPSTYTLKTAGEITLVAPSERAGYTFEGWFIGNEQVTNLAGYSGNLELTAKWKENSHSGAIELPNVGL